jgi:hypothetical protein
MKTFQVTKTFKGSVSGFDCTVFEKDQRVTDEQLGSELTAVALKEKWIKAVKAAPKAKPKSDGDETPQDEASGD